MQKQKAEMRAKESREWGDGECAQQTHVCACVCVYV